MPGDPSREGGKDPGYKNSRPSFPQAMLQGSRLLYSKRKGLPLRPQLCRELEIASRKG